MSRFIGLLLLLGSSIAAASPPAVKLDHLSVEAPKLVVLDGTGKSLELGEVAPGKNLIVHFWATWCAPCKKELPQFAELAKPAEEAGAVVRAISIDPPADSAKARLAWEVMEAGKLPFFIVSGQPDLSPGKALWAWGLPVTYFIIPGGPGGKIVARAMGTRDWSKLDANGLKSIFQNK
jgi:thiol-disulfide isomerase/thioredoxin